MVIDPRADGPSTDNQWSAYVIITDLGGPEAEDFVFHMLGRFKSRQLALDASLAEGKQKADEIRNSARIHVIS
jgi:hypothetical protein